MALINESQHDYYTGDGEDFGSYQFVSLKNIIDAFDVIYVGEGKLISKASRSEIGFHAQRSLQELSFDTLKCVKAQEIEVPPSLQMILPQDYVNYVKVAKIDSGGVERVLYPATKTSNPTAISQDADGTYQDDGTNLTLQSESDSWTKFKSAQAESTKDDYDTELFDLFLGQRYGLDPTIAQSNGNFYIDENAGKIHFSSQIANKTVIFKYISDGLGTEAEMRVHKFAEEAMYKCIAYSIMSTQAGLPEYAVQRVRKEKIAATRRAKLRLSNIKLEEISQFLRGMSKQIKH